VSASAGLFDEQHKKDMAEKALSHLSPAWTPGKAVPP
jgi:hypothetical protein